MKKDDKDSTFRFEIVEENGKDVTIEVTQKEYDKQIASGLNEDELLKPGRHIFRRGGFRERHPNLSLKNVEIRIIKDGKEKQFSVKNDNEKKAA